MPRKRDPSSTMTAAGFTVGDMVRVTAKNRHSHGRRGVVDGFSEEVPGVFRVRVSFSGLLMTFQPHELLAVKP